MPLVRLCPFSILLAFTKPGAVTFKTSQNATQWQMMLFPGIAPITVASSQADFSLINNGGRALRAVTLAKNRPGDEATITAIDLI